MISYIIILIIPLTAILTIYKHAENRAIQNAINDNLQKLSQTKLMIDRRLSEIDTIVEQVTLNPHVNNLKLVDNALKGNKTYSVFKTKKSLSDFSISNHFINGYYIFLNKGNIVVGPNLVYKYDKFMTNYLYYKQYDVSLYKEKYLLSDEPEIIIPSQKIKIKDKTNEVITYIRSLDLPSNKYGSVIILIDNTAIKTMLKSFNTTPMNYTYILDNKGKMISYHSNATKLPANIEIPKNKDIGYFYKKIKNNNILVIFTKSNLNQWTYVTLQPSNKILGYINDFRKLNLIMIILVIIIGIIVSYCFSIYETKPIA